MSLVFPRWFGDVVGDSDLIDLDFFRLSGASLPASRITHAIFNEP